VRRRGAGDGGGDGNPDVVGEPDHVRAGTVEHAPAATDMVVTTGDSEFGVMLFDDRGQAIYLFDRERTSTPDCYDECAAAWPPVVTDGAPQAGGAADPALLGTTQRTDGAVQVTYAGHPLYFYANEGPGEVLCHNVFLNGGLWFVVTPEGGPGPP
jgi:predicted lipoprotein with Yx(FWY)xxD motif